MALDLRGFGNEYPDWGGLYKMADTLERRKLKQDQLAAQTQSKKNAAGTFLQNYLDPKDYMSGTAYDPMILQGLQEAMQQGAKLAASGADSPTLMMALGPMVNRLTTYSAKAKNVNKQIEDSIKGMQADKQEGYNWQALKQEALKKAFYKTGPDGTPVLDLDQADPSVDWIAKAIDESPDVVTTPEAFDLYAKNAQVNKNLRDIMTMDAHGNPTRTKAHLIAQNYLTPEFNPDKTIKDFVPIHDLATEKGDPLYHMFTDDQGKQTKAQVRLLDEGIFESLRPGQINYIRGQVKKHLKEYRDATGEEITMDSPKAKMVARALAYDELNKSTRKSTNVEYVHQEKLSPQQIRLNIGSTPEWLQMIENQAEASKRGRTNVTGGDAPNSIQAIGRVFNGDPEYATGALIDKHGRKVIDITDRMQGGGLKPGRGVDFDYGGIYFDPKARSLVVEKEVKDEIGGKEVTAETIPENQVGAFLRKIAEANGIRYPQVKAMLEEMGYKDGRFTKAKDIGPQMELQERMQKKSWREAYKNPFGQTLNLQQ